MANRTYDDEYHRRLAREKQEQREAAARRERDRQMREAQRREQERRGR
jgi:hypothetical protein